MSKGIEGLIGKALKDQDHNLEKSVELALKLQPGGRFTDLTIDGECPDGFPPAVDAPPWSELQQYGLDHSTVIVATNTKHVDSKIVLSNVLIKAHHEHRRRQQLYNQGTGEKTSKILPPENVIDRLAVLMIAASRTTVPSKLLELLVLRLSVTETPRREGASTKPDEQLDLLKLLTLEPDISNRAAAKLIRVSDTTVARWKANREFKKTLAQYRKLLAQGIEIE